jgi:hypothetical protein
MYISFGAVMAVIAASAIAALSFMFQQRFAPVVLLFGVACVIWLAVSYYLDITCVYKVVHIYLIMGMAVVCTTAGMAGFLLRLMLRWLHH